MTREEAMAITRRYEGCRLESYFDSLGNRTIGVGHLQLPGDNRKRITQQRADAMFEGEDYPAAARHVIFMLQDPAVKCDLSTEEGRREWEAARQSAAERSAEADMQWSSGSIDSRYAALFDLAFNLGGRLDRFRGMRRAITRGDWNRAGDELLFVNPAAWTAEKVRTPYARQVGRRATDNAYRIRTNSEPKEAA